MSTAARVRWHDWGDEAFRKAEAADTPIVLALGTAWSEAVRAMDEQTYADPDVARLLNDDYVAIRVDADRRPDIGDRYYLGDHPTTAFLTPGGQLLGGATFVDRDQMRRLLLQLKAGYAANREKIAEEIARRDEKVEQVLHPHGDGRVEPTMEILRKTIRGILVTFDPLHAGFGKAPKLPCVGAMRVMLQALHETQGPDFQAIVVRTLDAMAERGMYDAEDGGFFHLSTNELWTAPRYEKLAEENAGLIKLYLDASIVTGADKYRARAAHALSWVQETLLDPARGVFYGSQFADREYYLTAPAGRERRPKPAVDRTVFTTSSSAMASAYLRAAEVLGDETLARVAVQGLDWLLREAVPPEGVAHYHDGRPQVFVLARDRLALASALLDAHEHTGERRFLDEAERISGPVLTAFWSEAEPGVTDRAVDALDRGELVRLRRNLNENGLAAENFARLACLTGRGEFRDHARRILSSFPDFLDGYGHPTAEFALAADRIVRPPEEVRPDPGALRPYLPRRVVARGRS